MPSVAAFMQFKLNTKILFGFAFALSVLLLTSAAAYYSIRQLSYYSRQVEHTHQVLQQTSELRMKIRDAQSAVRAYLLLSDSAYLNTYRTSSAGTQQNMDAMSFLTRDNLLQQQRLDTLRRRLAEEKIILEKWRKAVPSPLAARTLLLTDRELLDHIRNLLLRMAATEEELLQKRSKSQDFYENTTPLAIGVAAVLSIIIVVWLFSRISRELQANQKLQNQLSRVNEEITRRISLIEEFASQVVQGNYTAKIRDDDQQDSLGNLAFSLNHMSQTLHDNFAALQNRNKELDQFAYVASHDLKAPLRGVLTVVKWIEEELPNELSEQMRQYLEMMKGRLRRLEDLINGLLAYARAGRTEQKLEEVNVADLVREVADLVVPREFRVVLPDTLPTFITDRLSLQQVFTNLMGNAAKYHDKGQGIITVGCRDAGKCYEFRVQDDGPGIAPEYHEKIFLIFQTLRDRNSAESTGIGLSIVKKIVEEQKGSIHVESTAGCGATFVFTWPKTATTEEVQPA